ncbi:putative recombinase [Erwinia phage Papaline]|nr:putative recombinase [Erwinia phage Papaline]
MKVCSSCGLSKPLSDFYKWKLGKDGYRAACKCCSNSQNKASILKDRTASRRTKKKYVSINGKAPAKEYRHQNMPKYKAHGAVSSALRNGSLVRKVCECCGNPKAVAHHDDYSKPLSVRWLCPVHHMEWHALNGEALNG